MAKYSVTIKVEANSVEDASKLGNLLQNTANVVAYADIVKLLEKVKQNPSIVRTALKFI